MEDREFSGRLMLAASKYGKERDYWMDRLSGELVKRTFPYDRGMTIENRDNVEEDYKNRRDTVRIDFNATICERMMKIGKGSDYTLHMILTAGLIALLGKYTGSQDILIGIPIYRQETESEFLNTVLTLRNQLDDPMNFKDLLLQVKQTVIDANKHQNYPIETLLYQLNMTFTEDDFPLFDAVILLENIHEKSYVRHIYPNVLFSFIRKGEGPAARIEGKIEYNPFLYSRRTVEQIVRHYLRLIEGSIFNVETPIADIDILGEEEKKELLNDFNNTRTDYPRQASIHDLFDEQVQQHPDRIAVLVVGYPSQHVSYKELNERANRLAVKLKSMGVVNDSIVGLMVDRSIDMMVGIFGILKAGGAYLPIGIDYPQERIDYMLTDSGAKLLLATEDTEVTEKLEIKTKLVFITEKTEDKSSSENDTGKGTKNSIVDSDDLIDDPKKLIVDSENLIDDTKNLFNNYQYDYEYPNPSPSVSSVTSVAKNQKDLAYVIYTSGSTGKPKGVLTMHANVTRVVRNNNYVDISPEDRILQLSNYAFDGSVFDIFGALLNGAALVMISKDDVLAVDRLSDIIRREAITVFFITTVLFNTLVDMEIECFDHVRKVLFGGERVSVEHSWKALERMGKGKIIHVYGPTETTVYATYYFIDEIGEAAKTIPIGGPLANTMVYILDNHFKPVPLGVNGEIYIGGEGLARGYLNNPETTAERFCIRRPGTFLKKGSKTSQNVWYGNLYDTGDLGRWLPGGYVEFVGRADHQVKIRGFRVELGEIESRLERMDTVAETVVVDKKARDGDTFLCAYVLPEKSADGDFLPLDLGEVRQMLSKQVPDYMVPAYFMKVEKIPLTPNGKVNRKLLPEPEYVGLRASYSPPRNPIETKFVELWSEILGTPIEQTGIDTNFFDMGGHSLKATILISRLHKAFNVKVPLVELFRTPTIRELAQYIRPLLSSDLREQFSPIEALEKKEYYELSSAQKRLFVLQQMDLTSTFYNVSWIYEVDGNPDRERLTRTFRELIRRHESLRTSFEMVDERPVQRIHDANRIEFSITSLQLPKAFGGNPETLINSFIRPFNLSKAPLMRVALIALEENKYILMVDIHHIITDGTSMGVLFREFGPIYEGATLDALKLQYKEFTVWQNRLIERGEIKKQAEYWKKQFEGDQGGIPTLELPTDFPRPAVQTFDGGNVNIEIKGDTLRALKSFVSNENLTLYIGLLGVFNIFLSKITGQDDIIVGIPVAGRRHADLSDIVGMFVNTLISRAHPTGDKTVRAFLKELKETILNGFENQDYQFEELVEQVTVKRDVSRNPLFDVLFILQNMMETKSIDQEIKIEEMRFKPYIHETETTHFDLAMSVVESTDRIVFSIQYRTQLFRKETIARFGRYYTRVLTAVVEFPGRKIDDIDIIPEEEKRRILENMNGAITDYPQDKTIHDMFEAQAQQTPDRVAVVYSHASEPSSLSYSVTYGELNRRSELLAETLREKGVRPEDNPIVGIMANHRGEMITGLLGILKAGAAYLPIDPEYPEERVAYMLKDSGARLLVSTRKQEHEINCDEFSVGADLRVCPCVFFKGEMGAHMGAPLQLNTNLNKSSNLAYIIYTSGSTGKPKGVMVEHRNVMRLIDNSQFIEWQEGARLLMTGALVFDISTLEIWGPLLNGLTLVTVNKEIIQGPFQLGHEAVKQQINILHLVPQLFNRVMEESPVCFSALSYFLIGGDLVKPPLVNRLLRTYPSLKIVHCYGPTENTTFSTTFRVDKNDKNYDKNDDKNHNKNYHERIPIGKPLNNSSAFILDKKHKLLPIGVAGELCVGGDGVARGYLNNPELTSEKFKTKKFLEVRKPFFKKVSGPRREHIYHTGDLGKLLPDGNIEFLGRMDRQVKIRGFRIEPGEIENQLLRLEPIKDAIVLAREDRTGDHYLCAYIVSESDKNETQLKDHIRHYLPDYMVPSYIIRLDRMPLTPNGKVDRDALPEPGTSDRDTETWGAPATALEEKFAAIWSEVLGIPPERIGVDRSFFELGGHSIKVTIFIARVMKDLGVQLPLTEVFRTPFIRALAIYIENEYNKNNETNRIAKSSSDDGSIRNDNPTDNPTLLRRHSDAENATHLFLLHDGKGDVDGYVAFCNHLKHPFNYWGIRADVLTNGAPTHVSVEDMAGRYIEKIKSIQPFGRGAYWIAGWSLGGTIAFEIVRQLEQVGEQVAFLGLIDAPGPRLDIGDHAADFTLAHEKQWIGDYFPDHEIQEKINGAASVSELWAMIAAHFHERNENIQNLQYRIVEHLGQIPPYGQSGMAQWIHDFNTERTLTRARALYVPTSQIHTVAHYLKASRSPLAFQESWADYCAQPLKSYEISGDHRSILREPAVCQTAETVDDILRLVLDFNG
ncbi:MAG: amino acid adenylation domain-containing protein [Candidatus Omnitrophota bacterium]